MTTERPIIYTLAEEVNPRSVFCQNATVKLNRKQITKTIMRNFIVSLRQGLNFRLAFAIAAGAFGSAFQHGYNTGVVNAPQTLVMDWIMECNTTMVEGEDPTKQCEMTENRGTLIWSWIVGIFCVGGVMGGSAVGIVASRLGRYV